ncbi:MAG: ABC transporter permease [Bacteroidetes bacterium]|nr:ABC transporter permease [Bacteroidota bacterium]
MAVQRLHDNSEWDLVIEPQKSLFELPLLDLWRYRDLLWLLVKRDFVSFYKQTILGPLWFFIQPLFTTLVYTFIFGDLAGLSTDGLPQPLFYMAGITAWNYFAECLTKTSTVFRDNANIFGKVYFPRLIMPLSIVVSNLVRFGVQMVLFVMMMAYYAYIGAPLELTWALVLFPVLVLLMALLGLGLGLLVTALTTTYRDLAFLITFGVQLLMYTTTVIYPLSSAPAGYQWAIELNPMTGIIEAFRYGFLGRGAIGMETLGYSVIFTLVVLLLGVLIFNKTEKTFVDTV